MVWELVFMMVVLKIPVAYLCAVVWWAVRAEPKPLDGAALTAPREPITGPGRFRPHRRGPRSGPARRPAGTPRGPVARAEARR